MGRMHGRMHGEQAPIDMDLSEAMHSTHDVLQSLPIQKTTGEM